MSEKNTGRVSVPTNQDVVPGPNDLMTRWGARAHRE